MSYSETITRTDLTNILNEVLTPVDYSKVVEEQTITALNKTWTFRRIGNIVFIDASADMSGTVSAGSTNIGTLNASLRPKYNVYLKCTNANLDIRLVIAPTGVVTFYHPSQTTGSQNCGFSGYAWIVGEGQASPPPGADCADYIVEQGAGWSGYYRKWNSGNAEYWYNEGSSSGLNTTVWREPIWYGDYSRSNLWSGLFNSTPRVYASSNHQWIIGVLPYSITKDGCYLRYLTIGQASGQAYGASLYVRGTWK